MDGWRTTGKNIKPQLVVKIVGGKQVKYFIDESKSPTDHPEVDRNNSPNNVTDEDLSRESPFPDLRPDKENLLDALKEFPDRRCVTAPCGDRSRSYIHLKSTTNLSCSKQLMKSLHIAEEQTEDPQLCLFSRLSEELEDLDPHTLELMEKEVTSLDPSASGLVHQSELTFLLLSLKIPVKLSTLACVFTGFSDAGDPLQGEIWNASVSNTDMESVSIRSVNAEKHRETWLQRFQKMETGLKMSDTKNTGYVDRDKAKRLILNYSLIFDLNLSPLKVTEVTRNTQTEGKVHLASALQQPKER